MSEFCSVPMHLHARLSTYAEQSGRDDYDVPCRGTMNLYTFHVFSFCRFMAWLAHGPLLQEGSCILCAEKQPCLVLDVPNDMSTDTH